MKLRSAPSALHIVTFACTGAGCTFLGPFLPTLIRTWALQDRAAGTLSALLFLGSFAGTVLLGKRLRQSLRRGACAAAFGMLTFAFYAGRSNGLFAGQAAIALGGFGLGQLMSSLNLLAGSGSGTSRSATLARLGAAWSVGAILSPLLSTVMIPWLSPSFRIGILSLFFLLPLIPSRARHGGASIPDDAQEPQPLTTMPTLVTALCALAFLLYGGVEACLSGWLPLFATRYSATGICAAQWVSSAFWVGIIVSRLSMHRSVLRETEKRLLRFALAGTATCVTWLCVWPSTSAALVLVATVAGLCIGPVFPVMLSLSMNWRLGSRRMGAVLAACGLGAALLPLSLGQLSSIFSLRAAMAVPLVGVALLLFLRWQSPDSATETLPTQVPDIGSF